MSFPGWQPRALFSFLPLLLHLTSVPLQLAYIWKLGRDTHIRARKRTPKPRATTDDVRTGRQRDDGADWWEWTCSNRGKPPEAPSAVLGCAEASCQLLCLPKGLDTVAQLAPAGPWQQPGAQPKQRKKTGKKVTNNRELSLRTSTPPYCRSLSTRSMALTHHSRQLTTNTFQKYQLPGVRATIASGN